MAVSRTGTTPTPFGFVGKGQYQTDNDSGLMLLGHRYYDASVGRFISSDPAKAGDNWYAYCDNNPLRSIDPQGLWTLGSEINFTMGIIIKRWTDLRNDTNGLYSYGNKINPNHPNSGTWVGHQEQMEAWQRRLRNLLKEARKRSIDEDIDDPWSGDADKWATKDIPQRPVPKPSPKPKKASKYNNPVPRPGQIGGIPVLFGPAAPVPVIPTPVAPVEPIIPEFTFPEFVFP